MFECFHCQALSSLSDSKHEYGGVLSIKDLKEGSEDGCQSCAIIIEAVGIFFSPNERNNLQEIWIRSGENGLRQLSLWGINSEGEYDQIGLCEIFTLQGKAYLSREAQC